MTDNKASFFKDLWERRFFQLLATYIGVSWGILQFLQFAITRYNWNESIIDKFLLFVVVLIPGVAVFIYNHGRSGHDTWKNYEKILIPSNIILALIISTLFSPKSIQANEAMQTITIQTDQDSTVVRAVPKLQYTNRLILFPFDTKDDKPKQDWLKFATPLMMSLDLEQDMRLFAIHPFALKGEYGVYNKKILDKIDLGTMINIARDNYSDYFLKGKVDSEKDQFKIVIEMYSSDDGKKLLEKSFEGKHFFKLIDQISEAINTKLYSKEHFKETNYLDLPAESLVTNNMEALQHYIRTASAVQFDMDIDKADEWIDKSIKLDDNCAECYGLRSQLAYLSKDSEKAKENIKSALLKGSGLPERQKLVLRNLKYQLEMDMDRSTKLLETWSQLYPSDYTPVMRLMGFYEATLNLKKAVEVGERAIENGHEGSLYTRLAGLYNKLGNTEKAKEYLQRFADRYPHKSNENSQLGDIYLKSGELDNALEVFEKINIYKPDDLNLRRKIANIYNRKGNPEKAEEILKNAMSDAHQPLDSFRIISSLEQVYFNKGMIKKCLALSKQKEKVGLGFMPKIAFDSQFGLQTYIYYDAIDSMELYKKDMEKRFSSGAPQDEMMKYFVDMIAAKSKEDVEKYRIALDKTASITKGTMGPYFKYAGLSALAYLDEKYEEAYDMFKLYQDSTTVDKDLLIAGGGNIYMKAKKYTEFVELLDDALITYPANAKHLFLKASALKELGKKDEAVKLLEQSLQIWSEADSNLVAKREAQEMLSTLK